MAISHVIGFDDGPFPRGRRGDVPVVGTVFSETTFTGVVSGKVRKDGRNATEVLDVIRRPALRGVIPEPLRAAHLIAGGVWGGESRRRA